MIPNKDGDWRVEVEPFYPCGQGITKSREHWYFSITHHDIAYLFKLDCGSYKISKHRKIPFKDLGYNHIGDLDFSDNLIYASLEDVNYEKPRIVLFNEDL